MTNKRPLPNKHLLSIKRPLYALRPTPINVPCLIDAPYEKCSKILGFSKKEENHSIHSVSYLINKALHVSSYSMSSSK